MEYGIFIFVQICFAIYLVYYIIAFLSGAPYVPSTNPTSDSMIRLARLSARKRAYDLGSGDGKLLSRIAATGAHAIGIEINPLLVLFSTMRSFLSPYRNSISVRWGSFWTTTFADADVVFVYLLPLRMEKLEKKLAKECKKGTIVVSNSFLFPHWKILRQDPVNHVYVYKMA